MTITRVASQQAGTHANSATTISLAYPVNVTAGNLIVISAGKFSTSGDPFLVGDISKSAGTATLGAFTMDKANEYNAGAEHDSSVVYSAHVTGSGSCTITIAGAPGGSYLQIALEEFHSDLTSAFAVEGTNGATGGTGAPNTGNVTSAGAAAFVGSLLADTATDGAAITEGAAFTKTYEDEQGATDVGYSAIDSIVSTGTTDAASWTAPTTKPWSASLVVYKEVVAGGGPVIPVFMNQYRQRSN